MSRYRTLLAIILVLVVAAVLVLSDKKYTPMRRGLDIAGGVRVVLEAKPGSLPRDPEKRADKMSSVLNIMRKRSGGFQGVVEPLVHLQGSDRVVVELPGVKDPKKAVASLKQTASLEFYWLKDVQTDRNPAAKWEMSHPTRADEGYMFTAGDERIDSKKNPELVLQKVVNAYDPVKNPGGVKPILTGADLLPQSGSDIDPEDGPVIKIQFDRKGTDVFRDFTRAHLNEILAIFYDGEIVTAPTIRSAIPNGDAKISGFQSLDDAQQKAEVLNAGALPVPLDIKAMDTVDATLGRDTVHQVILAGLVGLGLVVLFMLLYYRLPGLIADFALAIYAILTLAAFKLLGVTMSLPAIAGFILTIGMAVDANILIFERLKEELRSGKTLRAAIDAGFSRAFTAIFDSNMCTAITSAILMWYGTGAVQSFATTLIIGVAISMFTAITVTRTILHLLVNAEWAQNESLFGLGTSWFAKSGRQMNIVGKRKYFYALSLLFIVPGVFFLVTSGLKPGIEFKSGTQISATFEKNVNLDDVQRVVKSAGVDNTVQISQGKTAFITTDLQPGKDPKDGQRLTEVQNALRDQIGPFKVSTSEVGATISKELTRNAFLAVLMASAAIILYLSFRFAIGGFLDGLKFGVCAVIALIHDTLFIMGMFAIFGKFLGWEIDSLFVTAILTVIGFSVHDTIVVYDRIRENLRHRVRGDEFEEIANRSILQTFSRSINTSMTVLITLLALILLGGPTLQHFYVALFLGIITGTYSSIFNATPLVVEWERLSRRGAAPSAPRRKIEEKPLVSTEKARELKPIADATGTEVADSGEAAAVTTAADRVKVKPKKKKKRF